MSNATPNKENIRKLVDALRSGDYKQTTGRLARIIGGEVQHCCLGVACEVAGLEGVVDAYGTALNYDGGTASLPDSAIEFFGFNSYDPHLLERAWPNDGQASALNDSGNYTFAAIADLFEAKYLCANEVAA